ncbi:MAG: hypothetical protein SGPRY_002223, partial [Prymnesium sp.]
MVGWLPRSPRYPGDSFDVPVYVHTGQANFALSAWSVEFEYDVTLLSLSSQLVVFSSVYQQPTTAFDPVAGTYSVVASGLDPASSSADVTNKRSLYLMTLRFQVLAAPASQLVLNGTVRSLVNQGTQEYLSDAAMSFTDLRGGLQQGGLLSLEEIVPVGVFAYTSSASVVNSAVLDGAAVSGQVLALESYNRAASASTLSSLYSCRSDATSVITLASGACTFSLTSQQTRGGAAVISVEDSSSTQVASVTIRA